MKLIQSSLQKTFTVKHNGKKYYVDYASSDGQTLLLANRNYWEVIDQEWEGLENEKLKLKLIKFCIKNFNNYKPDINV